MGIFSSIFRIVIPIVAAVIGFVITGGNPMGAVYGYGIGSMIAGALFPPEAENKQSSGPGQLQLSTSNYGGAIPVVYGARRVAGNLIWAGNLVTVAVEHDAGGGGCMGSDATYTTYEYYISFAMAICVGRGKQEVRRIFKNKDEYVYNRRDGRAYSITNTQSLIQQYGCALAAAVVNGLMGQLGTGAFAMTMYDGTQTTADPTMAAVVSNPCPYRNLCYVVFPNFYLGNTPMMPQLSFEVCDVIANDNPDPRLDASLLRDESEGIWCPCGCLYAEGFLWTFYCPYYDNPSKGTIRLDKIDLNSMSVVRSEILTIGNEDEIVPDSFNYGNVRMLYMEGFIYLHSLYRLSKISCSSMTIHRQWWLGTVLTGYPPDDQVHPYHYGAKNTPYITNPNNWDTQYRPEDGENWEQCFVKLGRVYDAGEWNWHHVGWSPGSRVYPAYRYSNMSTGEGSPEYLYFKSENWDFSVQAIRFRLKDGAEEVITSSGEVKDNPVQTPIRVGDHILFVTSQVMELLDPGDQTLQSYLSIESVTGASNYARAFCYCESNERIYLTTVSGTVYAFSYPSLSLVCSTGVGGGINNCKLILVAQDSWSDKIFALGGGGLINIYDLDLNVLRSFQPAKIPDQDYEWEFDDQDYVDNGDDLVDYDYHFIQGIPNQNVRGLGRIYAIGKHERLESDHYVYRTSYIKIEYPPDFLYVEDVTPQDVTEDILTNKFYGNGLETDIIDTEKNNIAKTYAIEKDLLVAPAFDRQRSILDALQYVLQHHDGFITYCDGKIAHRQFETRSEDIAFALDENKSDAFADGEASPNWRPVIE